MAADEIVMRARWEYDSSELEKLKADVDAAKEKIKASSAEMDISYKKLGMSVAHLSTAGLMLQGTWERVAEGQMSVAEGAVRSIPALVSLASAIWTVVTGETARAIAHSIAHALSGPAGWAILAGAVGAAAVGIALASGIPSRQFGGPIEETGPYFLHQGEFVVSREGRLPLAWLAPMISLSRTPAPTPVTYNINIHGPVFRSRSDMDYLVDNLKRMGQA